MEQYNNYFDRQIQLWGISDQKKLLSKRIVIVGCGGLGCSLGFALGTSGIGYIDLIDFDKVSISNIHRQLAFKLDDIDKYKCDVLKSTILAKSTFTNINTYKTDFENFTKLTTNKYDLIIDATDNLEVRTTIDKFCKTNDIPWVYGSVEEFHGQVCFFENTNFTDIFQIKNHKQKGIATPSVMQIASLQANLALRFLLDLNIKKDTLYYLFFDKDGEFIQQKFFL